MLSVTNKPFFPSVVMLNVVMLSIVMLNVVAKVYANAPLRYIRVGRKCFSGINTLTYY